MKKVGTLGKWGMTLLKEAIDRGDCYIDDDDNIVLTEKGCVRAALENIQELLNEADREHRNFNYDESKAIVIQLKFLSWETEE